MKCDHFQFLCDVGELGALLAGSSDIEAFLQRLVRLVARHLDAHVCSIYLLENGSQDLVLRANVGLNPDCLGKTRLKEGEGLVGTTLRERHAILDNHASHNPRYKYFPDIGEEQYDSFLSVPIVRESENIGVLTVQREEQNHFSEDDLNAMRVVSCQLAGCIASARALMHLVADRRPEHVPIADEMVLIRAQVASPGYAMGHSHILSDAPRSLDASAATLPPHLTLADFRGAMERTISQIEQLQLRVSDKLPEAVALIFSAHLMILKDRAFVERISEQIETGRPVAESVTGVARYYLDLLARSQHAYMQEKVQDIEDVVLRLLDNLRDDADRTRSIESGRIVIARGLFPSELVMLSLEEPAGIVLVSGGATSHVSILARSLQIPLLIADDPRMRMLEEGKPVLLDGLTGEIHINPRADVVHEFTGRRDKASSTRAVVRRAADTTRTRDGTRVRLMANINLLRDVAVAQQVNAEGIGLYRTEFPFMMRSDFPDEEELFLIYGRLVDGLGEWPVTIRTLDVGGDKRLGYHDHGEEGNPELGLRSIRFSLRYPDIFRQQIRAVLRAAANTRDVRIMFPMISSLDEFRQARSIVEACAKELSDQGSPCHPRPSIGMMVELPSVLETAEEFCQEADFFSIGSNDFIQYMLAADRGNETVAGYYCPHHPAVLRGIARFVRTVRTHDRPVSVCGEMAHQMEYIPFLLGVGVRNLSVDPHYLVELQDFIQSLTIPALQSEADILLGECTVAGVTERLREFGRIQGPAGDEV
ncbi:MAG: phosphoenolpyruvate--protein phosphotransferase [Planctomycetes bacterium]|nr:phosphoenolpyruvate--protein phosphotransferase [Planctomycetota bacterium]